MKRQREPFQIRIGRVTKASSLADLSSVKNHVDYDTLSPLQPQTPSDPSGPGASQGAPQPGGHALEIEPQRVYNQDHTPTLPLITPTAQHQLVVQSDSGLPLAGNGSYITG